MKKYINPMPDNFAPVIWGGGMTDVWQDIWDVIDNLLGDQDIHTAHGNGDGIIVSGCGVSLNGGGPNIDIAAGVIYLTKTKEFLRVAATTNVADPHYATLGSATIQKSFKDGVNRDFIVNKTASMSASVPGDNNYVRFALGTPANNSKTLKELLAISVAQTVKTGSLVIGNFTQGPTTVDSADYKYILQGKLLYFVYDMQLDTDNATIRFTLPDSMTHIAFDDDFYQQQPVGIATGTGVTIQLGNIAGNAIIQINDSGTGTNRVFRGIATFIMR